MRSAAVWSGTVAHEIGHQLGANHDQSHCAEGDFGHIMGYKKGHRTFSACSVQQIYDNIDALQCLYRRHGECAKFRDFDGVCGDGELNGFEECDDKHDKCCDMDKCTLKRGCCDSDNGEVFECVVVDVDADAASDPTLAAMRGAYGGCARRDQSAATMFEQTLDALGMRPRAPLFLKQRSTVTVSPAQCSQDSNSEMARARDGESFWFISSDSTSTMADAVCVATKDDGVAFPARCEWRTFGCHGDTKVLVTRTTAIEGVTATKRTALHDILRDCLQETEHDACAADLDWDAVPHMLEVRGAAVEVHSEYDALNQRTSNWTHDLNGVYRSEQGRCWDGRADFVSEAQGADESTSGKTESAYLHLLFSAAAKQWLIAYLNLKTLVFAVCDADDLAECRQGRWRVKRQYDDQQAFELEAGMLVEAKVFAERLEEAKQEREKAEAVLKEGVSKAKQLWKWLLLLAGVVAICFTFCSCFAPMLLEKKTKRRAPAKQVVVVVHKAKARGKSKSKSKSKSKLKAKKKKMALAKERAVGKVRVAAKRAQKQRHVRVPDTSASESSMSVSTNAMDAAADPYYYRSK